MSCSSVHLDDSEHSSFCSYSEDHSVKTHIWVHENSHKQNYAVCLHLCTWCLSSEQKYHYTCLVKLLVSVHITTDHSPCTAGIQKQRKMVMWESRLLHSHLLRTIILFIQSLRTTYFGSLVQQFSSALLFLHHQEAVMLNNVHNLDMAYLQVDIQNKKITSSILL